MSESTRPKRVVIVDADNPMEEIHGEFYWREDHERALAIERERAYEAGYRDGLERTVRQPVNLTIRRRRWTLTRLVITSVATLVAVSFLLTLIGSIAG
jgi:hypothetical protein